jgi:hypothetical protein
LFGWTERRKLTVMTREQIETGLYRYAHRLVTQQIKLLALHEQKLATVTAAESLAQNVFESTLSHLRMPTVDVDEVMRTAARHAIDDHVQAIRRWRDTSAPRATRRETATGPAASDRRMAASA